VYDDIGKFNEALKYYNNSLLIYEKIRGKDSVDCADSLYNIGMIQ
jgi:hypothetical protein